MAPHCGVRATLHFGPEIRSVSRPREMKNNRYIMETKPKTKQTKLQHRVQKAWATLSEALPSAPSMQADSPVEDLSEDTLLGSPILSSAGSTSTITGAFEGVLLGSSDPEMQSTEETDHTYPALSRPQPQPQLERLSGAARRKRKKLAALAARTVGDQGTEKILQYLEEQLMSGQTWQMHLQYPHLLFVTLFRLVDTRS